MSIVKNFLYNVSYQLLTILLPLLTVPYVSKVLGASRVGDYAFTNANTQYFILFGMVGITLYGNREIAYVRNTHHKLKDTFYSIYTVQLITTTVSLILFSLFVFLFSEGEYRYLYLAQGINILAAMFDISWLFMGLEEFKKTVIRNTIVRLISLLSIFIFVKNSDDIIIYTIILSLSTLIGNLTFWLYIPKMFGMKLFKISNIKVHFYASLMLFIPQIAVQIYILLDRTLLGLITNTVEVGYYENSQKIVKVILTLATAISTVMMPKIANTVASRDLSKVKYYVKNSFFFVSALSIPLMFGLMGVAEQLSPWFFTDQFQGIDKLVSISSLIILAISWSNVIGMQLLIPLNRVKEFTISVTAGAIINFALNLILLKQLGAVGACISTIIAEFVVTFLQFYFIRNFIKFNELLKPILLFIPIGFMMFICVSYIGEKMGAGIVTNIVQGILGVIIYIGLLELIYRIIYKISFITHVKRMVNE